MKPQYLMKRLLMLLLAMSLLLGSSCGKPDSANNLTATFVTLTAITGGTDTSSSSDDINVLESDVLTNGYTEDDTVSVTFTSQKHSMPFEELPAEFENSSPLDTVVFSRYHVSHSRTDGGPNPADFSSGITIQVTPPTGSSTSNIETAVVVVVRAFDKSRSPLKELQDKGEIFTTTTFTFYGEDGYGNDIEVSGSIPISFANYQDS